MKKNKKFTTNTSASSVVGRVFNVGRYQVTVEEVIAEGKDVKDDLNFGKFVNKLFIYNQILMCWVQLIMCLYLSLTQ